MQKKDLKYWIAGAVFVIIVIGATFPYMIAKSRINSLKDQLRKDGEPVTLREYAAKYYKPVPDDKNGVATFDDAYSLHVSYKNFNRLIIVGIAYDPLFDQKISPLLLPYVNEFLKDNKELLAKMEKLKEYDYFRPEYNWNERASINFERLNEFRSVERLYALKVESLIQQNKSSQTNKTLLEMFHVNKLLSQNPFMVGQLTFFACETLALDALERSMNSLSSTPAQLKKLQDICAEHQKLAQERWYDMWKLEACIYLLFYNLDVASVPGIAPYVSIEYIKEIPIKYRRFYYYYSGCFHNDLYNAVKAKREIQGVPVDIFSKRKPELEKIDTECKKNQSGYLFCPVGSSTSSRMYRAIARLRCAATACAVERYRLKYGKLPKDLNALVPEFMDKVPVDPFDGKPLRYFRGTFELEYSEPFSDKKKEKEQEDSLFFAAEDNEFKIKTVTAKKSGYHVYSVGENLTDDKILKFDRHRYHNLDIGFLVIDKKQ